LVVPRSCIQILLRYFSSLSFAVYLFLAGPTEFVAAVAAGRQDFVEWRYLRSVYLLK